MGHEGHAVAGHLADRELTAEAGGPARAHADGRELLAEGARIPIRPHTTTYPLADANQALQDFKADRLNGAGVLIVGC